MDVLERIACHNFVVADGYAYFSNWFYNGLYKVEIETGKTIFLDYFRDEKLSQWNIHKEIFLKNNKVYACPWKGRHVHIWNLADHTLCSVEIRRKDDKRFFADEVIRGENSIYFVPDRKGIPIKKMDLESLRVTEAVKNSEIQGTAMSESKDIFPYPELVEKYHIEHTDKFFWRQVSCNVWYGFKPLGRHIMRYVKGIDELEILPLTVINQRELNEHVQKIKAELLNDNPVWERTTKIQDFMEKVKIEETQKAKTFRKNKNIGERIWEYTAI